MQFLHFGIPVETNHITVNLDHKAFHDFCVDSATHLPNADHHAPPEIEGEQLLYLFLLLEELQALDGSILVAFFTPSLAPPKLKNGAGAEAYMTTSLKALYDELDVNKFDHIILCDLLSRLKEDEDKQLIDRALGRVTLGGSLILLPLPLAEAHTETFRPDLPPGQRTMRQYDHLSFYENLLKGKAPFYDLEPRYYSNVPQIVPGLQRLTSLKIIKRNPGFFRKLEDTVLGASEVHYYKNEMLPK